MAKQITHKLFLVSITFLLMIFSVSALTYYSDVKITTTVNVCPNNLNITDEGQVNITEGGIINATKVISPDKPSGWEFRIFTNTSSNAKLVIGQC